MPPIWFAAPALFLLGLYVLTDRLIVVLLGAAVYGAGLFLMSMYWEKIQGAAGAPLRWLDPPPESSKKEQPSDTVD